MMKLLLQKHKSVVPFLLALLMSACASQTGMQLSSSTEGGTQQYEYKGANGARFLPVSQTELPKHLTEALLEQIPLRAIITPEGKRMEVYTLKEETPNESPLDAPVADLYESGCVRIVDVKSGKIGYADNTGRQLLPPAYYAATSFSGSHAAVSYERRKPIYASATDGDSMITGYEPQYFAIIDKQGKMVKPAVYTCTRENVGGIGSKADYEMVYTNGAEAFYLTDKGEMKAVRLATKP